MIISDTLEPKSVVHAPSPRLQEPWSSSRANSFDFLRLVLATLVLLSHCWAIPGVMNGEPLIRLTHDGISFGEIAVDGFFIISGFLVSQSWQRSRNILDYLRRRVLRIFPGFIAASLLSTFVVGAFAVTNRSGNYSLALIGKSLFCLVTLSPPPSPPGAFAGLTYHTVNAPLWTIQFEFLCYLLVIVLGVAGMYRRRLSLLGFCVVLWAIAMLLSRHVVTLPAVAPHLASILAGLPYLGVLFFSGACFYLYRDRIRYSHRAALLALGAVVLSLISHRLVFLALPTAGAYLLLYCAFKAPAQMHSFGRYGDFSYGIYLYGWPVQMLITWYAHDAISPWLLFPISLLISFLAAALSWHLIEKPFLNRKGATAAKRHSESRNPPARVRLSQPNPRVDAAPSPSPPCDPASGERRMQSTQVDCAFQNGVSTPSQIPADRWIVLLLFVYCLGIVCALLRAHVGLTWEDGFYYFNIAQNLANGAGSTFDGLHPTNGYHPLWLLCLIPIFRLTSSPLTALTLGTLLQGALMAAGAAILYLTVRREWEWPAASLASLIWIHLIYPHALSGLECSLHALGMLITAYLYLRWFGKELPQRSGSYLALGLALSLTFLARLETILLAAILGLYLLCRERQAARSAAGIRRLLTLSLPVIATCMFYLCVNLWLFGHPLPISSVIKREWSAWMLSQDPHYRAHGWIVAKVFNLLWPLQDLRANHGLAIGAYVVPVLFLIAAARRGSSSRYDRLWQAVRPYSPFVLYGTVQFCSAALLYHGEMTLTPWYYVVQPWLTALLVGFLFQQMISRTHPSSCILHPLALAVLAAGWCFVPLKTLLTVKNLCDSMRQGLTPTPLQDTAQWIRTHLPPDAVIGSWNAGTIGYLSQRRVVNLDGLVNSWDFYQHDRHDLCRYWQKTGITYLADAFQDRYALALVPTFPAYASCCSQLEPIWDGHYVWKDPNTGAPKEGHPAFWHMKVYRISNGSAERGNR